MDKLLKFIFTCKHFRPLSIVKINWVRQIKLDVWINRRTYIIWREKVDVWTGPKARFKRRTLHVSTGNLIPI